VSSRGDYSKPQLTPQEKSALQEYGDELYRQVNAKLRGHKADLMSEEDRYEDEDLDEIISSIDSAFKKSKTTKDLLVHRSVTSDDLPGVPGHHDMEGKSFVDKGFASTSFTQSKAKIAGLEDEHLKHKTRVQLNIRLPKGSKAIHMEGITRHAEDEVLLPRGTRFKITRVVSAGEYDPGSDAIINTVIEVTARTP
jgi:hypothetical protein